MEYWNNGVSEVGSIRIYVVILRLIIETISAFAPNISLG
jgi:hypothetical protein